MNSQTIKWCLVMGATGLLISMALIPDSNPIAPLYDFVFAALGVLVALVAKIVLGVTSIILGQHRANRHHRQIAAARRQRVGR
jgi:heme/copper-type cytochrome/quinol oxidase subunit 2